MRWSSLRHSDKDAFPVKAHGAGAESFIHVKGRGHVRCDPVWWKRCKKKRNGPVSPASVASPRIAVSRPVADGHPTRTHGQVQHTWSPVPSVGSSEVERARVNSLNWETRTRTSESKGRDADDVIVLHVGVCRGGLRSTGNSPLTQACTRSLAACVFGGAASPPRQPNQSNFLTCFRFFVCRLASATRCSQWRQRRRLRPRVGV